MGWTQENISRAAFIADPSSVSREPGGRQIDWDQVGDAYRSSKETVKANGAAAAGATAITVDALPIKVQAGQLLNFGTYAPVTVTTSGAAAAATALPVTALSGPIPSGTVLNFTGAGEFAVLTADAAAGATSLAVEALDATIENADTALFPGGTIQARVTANAAAGATSLTVDELQFAVADNAEAIIGGSGSKVIPAGTVMAELTGGKVVPRAARPGSETAIGLLETGAAEDSKSDALSGYGLIIGGVIYENLLPDAAGGTTISSTYKTELQTAGVGTGFAWRTYADDTGS
jgi:hypothetical protein